MAEPNSLTPPSTRLCFYPNLNELKQWAQALTGNEKTSTPPHGKNGKLCYAETDSEDQAQGYTRTLSYRFDEGRLHYSFELKFGYVKVGSAESFKITSRNEIRPDSLEDPFGKITIGLDQLIAGVKTFLNIAKEKHFDVPKPLLSLESAPAK